MGERIVARVAAGLADEVRLDHHAVPDRVGEVSVRIAGPSNDGAGGGAVVVLRGQPEDVHRVLTDALGLIPGQSAATGEGRR